MRAVVIAGMLLCAMSARSQVIDSVIVERYHVRAGPSATDPPLVTYRLFIDLAPGHQLQMVYGDEHHPLWIGTSTSFFNDEVNGVKFADRLDPGRLNVFPLAIDSWLTMGAASEQHIGVPLLADTDGSVLGCPPYSQHDALRSDRSSLEAKPLCVADGLQADTAVHQVVSFRLDPTCMGKLGGSSFSTTDGAWAVLGGMKGATMDNVILIAQLSTTGELSFDLNLQIATAQRVPLKFVAHDPREGELTFPGLSYGARRSTRAGE